MKTIVKHCGIEYKVIVPYSETTNTEVIEVNGNVYKISRLPRPTKTEAELMRVFVNGVKYNSFAKFLKSI
jgi:hypothetical protein